jgi:hypothetical protein
LLTFRRGQGLVEYAMILFLIVIIIIVMALDSIGGTTSEPLQHAANALSGSTS